MPVDVGLAAVGAGDGADDLEEAFLGEGAGFGGEGADGAVELGGAGMMLLAVPPLRTVMEQTTASKG